MNFAGALFDLQRGHKIKRKHWGGYWYLNKNNRIIMHTYDNKEIDLQDTKDIIYTLSNCVADDWEIVKDW